MNIHTNIPLKNYLTMRLGGPARFMGEFTSTDELIATCKQAKEQQLPIFILGGGSNVLAHDEGFTGIVLRDKIMGFEVAGEDETSVTFKIGAGENWDEVVRRTVEMNLSGIEAMSAIPGTAGAAPVQNVGAYGQEIADTFVELEAYDMVEDRLIILSPEDCHFSYRSSLFRESAKNRFVITNLTLKLYRSPPQPPFYEVLQRYLDEHQITFFTPAVIREAVTKIRADKLPDPSRLPNTGSFFKNAIVEDWRLKELQKDYPDMPSYDLGDKTFKVPTGWLIEQAGFKGKLLHGMRVHDKNALVLINESATGYADLATARDEIKGGIRDKFRITIEQEPLEL